MLLKTCIFFKLSVWVCNGTDIFVQIDKSRIPSEGDQSVMVTEAYEESYFGSGGG